MIASSILRRLFASAIALVATMVLSAPARAEFFVGDYNGDYLIRRSITVPANETLIVQTSGCANGGDTVLFLLEGSYGSPTAVTRSFNDDFNGGFCSFVSYQNNSGVSKDFTLVLTTYTPGAQTDVQLHIQFNSGTTTENVRVGGVAYRFSGNLSAETLQVLPVRGWNGGMPVDTVMFVINPNGGGTAKFDDDSSLRYLSRIQNNLNCANTQCWLVVGNYSYGSYGGPLAVWSQNPAADADADGISDGMEQILTSYGRLPVGAQYQKDSDLDGLSDFVELVGVATASTAGWDASLPMPWQGNMGGPDPMLQDLFIEIDWMEDTGAGTAHTHEPYFNLGWDLMTMFTDDSSFTGRSIRVHAERSQSIGHWDRISYSSCGGAGDVSFYTIKNNPVYFDPLRSLIYHYAIFAHSEKDDFCNISGSSGRAEILGNDVYVTLGFFNSTDIVRGTFMHELGHNLYLDHHSNDNASDSNRSCVHSSVMNYKYQFGGWPNAGGSVRAFGYSNGSCASGTFGTCTNTCINRCVPSGQVSPKITCPLATSGPNAGKRVSDGSCDCDRPEWSQPGAVPVANRVSLAFQSGFGASDGAPLAAADAEASREYIAGGQGQKRAFGRLHQRAAERKRQKLENDGLVEGVDFVVNPENGKTYAAN